MQTPNSWALIIRTPTKGHPIQRNSHRCTYIFRQQLVEATAETSTARAARPQAKPCGGGSITLALVNMGVRALT